MKNVDEVVYIMDGSTIFATENGTATLSVQLIFCVK